MVWLGLLVLMLAVAAAPGVSIYLEHLRAASGDAAEARNDGQQRPA